MAWFYDKKTREKKRVYHAERKNDVIKLYHYDSSGDKTMTTITRSNVNYENANKAYKAIIAFDKKTKFRF